MLIIEILKYFKIIETCFWHENNACQNPFSLVLNIVL